MTDTPSDITQSSGPRTQPQPRWAKIVSDFFSPLLVPTYAMAVAMWLTPLRVLPERSRLISTAIVAFLTAVLPALAIMALIRAGRVSDAAISDRRERFIPFSISALCFLFAAWILHRMGAPAWLSMFYVAAAAVAAVELVVSIAWKISAHAGAMGGLAGMFLWFTVSGVPDLGALASLSVAIICGGLVCSSRLALHRHTFLQVVAGFILGLGGAFGMMWIH